QQYKQLLMMAGFDRYFQIAPCFRDEDPRADRLPGEFYQLDVEMSFVEQEDIFQTMEPVITGVFSDFANGKPVTGKWPRIPYAEAMKKYGSDKPDLRVRNPHTSAPLEMADVSEHFRGSGFKIFARMLEDEKNQVWAIPAPSGGSRAFCDRMNSWAQGEGQPGLGYIFWRSPETLNIIQNVVDNTRGNERRPDVVAPVGAGPIATNIGSERTEQIRQMLGLKEGDAAFFVAGNPEKFAKFAGNARNKVGEDLNLIDKERYELAWIVDFPMFEYNDEDKKVDFSHNPFSMPQGGLEALQSQDPLTIKAFQYDIVCNGFEIASGGIRNHKPEAMVKAFELAGYSEQTVIDRFGGMYRAFQYGAPPHGGMAAGVDRIVMLLCGTQNLREISLFPMNQQALDVLMGAPSEVTPKQLRELHIRLNPPN
ncbi:MAG: aspartate--tRNA ligase, partial [Beijerinckiaceae bacterium]